MKRYDILRRGAFALLLAAGLCGCIKDNTFSNEAERVDMTLALDTYAATNDPNAADNEAAVKSAWVYIFNAAGVLENPDKTGVSILPSGEVADDSGVLNGVWNVTVGQKDIYVLLNAGNLTRGGVVQPLAGYNPSSKAELESLLTDPANFDTDFPASGSAGMLMSGKTPSPVNVSASASTVTVPVARRYARIDLRLRRKADLSGAAIYVGETTFTTRRERAFAFAPATESTGSDVVYKSNHSVVMINPSETDYTAVTSLYTMPRTGAAKAACLEIAVAIDGTIYNLPVYINSGAINGGTANNENLPLDIVANKVYKVDVTLGRQGVDLQMDILEWSLRDLDGDIDGSSLVVESPARVKAGVATLIPVQSKADEISVKLSSAAVTAGYTLQGANASTGILTVPVTDGKASIPVTGPSAYPIGDQYTMTLVAGNIRRNVLLRVDGTPVLEVGDDVLEFPYKRTTKSYTVTSCIDLGNGTKVALPWTAEFSTDGGATWTKTKPGYLPTFTTSDNGSTTAKSYSVIMAAQEGVVNRDPNPSDQALKDADPVSGTYDLSTNGGTSLRNTANCYVVNAAGTYTFPLVYGNAIRNGSTYDTAYTFRSQVSANTLKNVLETFVDSQNSAITSPYIYSRYTPASAVIIWQDTPNLIQNVRLSGTTAITFDVPRSTIKQGNAVIAVRNSAQTILWSWHIWVTDYKLDEGLKYVTNNQDVTYSVMPINLGWCLSHIIDYDPRSVLVRLTQPENGLTKTFTINQTPHQVRIGNQPFYQWGRKDPMPPSYYDADTNTWDEKSYYPGSSIYTFYKATRKSSVGTSIQSPNVFFCITTSNYDWCDYNGTVSGKTDFYNLWNVNNTETTPNDNTTVKTIYDPSPAGYHIPPPNVFSGFTYNSEQASTSKMDAVNSPYIASLEYVENRGWEFYCNPMPGLGEYNTARGTIFMPVTGFRDGQTGTIANGYFGGYYWMAIPYYITSHVAGSAAQFSSSLIPVDINNRSYGRAVRPIVGN